MDKKIGVMQPYIFPYLGYFQLISALDTFVIYDNTQFISRGWVNRNRILVNGKASFITFPLKGSHLTENINKRYFLDDIAWHKKRLLNGIYLSYARAPFFRETFPLIESIVNFKEQNVALFNENSIRILCRHLGIFTKILVSSQLPFYEKLSGTERLINLLNGLGADVSINPIGGFHLYRCEEFRRHGITLKFIKTEDIPYRQFNGAYVTNLSIIDMLMFVPLIEIQERLLRYSLIDNFNIDFDSSIDQFRIHGQ